MNIILFFSFSIFFLSNTLPIFPQFYFVANSDITSNDVRVMQGELRSNEEIPYVIDDEKLKNKKQFCIISDDTMIILFTKKIHGAESFFSGCIGRSPHNFMIPTSERVFVSSDRVKSGKIYEANIANECGMLQRIIDGEILIEYNELFKTVTITFNKLRKIPAIAAKKEYSLAILQGFSYY